MTALFRISAAAALLTLALVAHAPHAKAETKGRIEFNRDVRPILSDKCFKCHGPDSAARKADLRLDRREDALAEHDSGRSIVPGKPDDSAIVHRIETADEDELMPPPKSNLKLSKAEAAVLRQWIAEGAEYEPHWAFVAPRARKDEGGRLKDEWSGWARNGIDDFVLAKLRAEGLTPSPEADPATLVRRLSLAITGLPPTPEEIESFTKDCRSNSASSLPPSSFEARLLASPRFGERMAVDWLDAARFSDTNGYFRDTARQTWPWREWVIGAFNSNMPYDQFTIEQIAGDLLPQATLSQKVATGFNRNHMVTGESGIIDEEYRVEYVADRLETTGTVWMGLTIGCCRCHDHKYDPISQREYYQLFSFFNNGPETGLVKDDDPPPTLDVATAEQRAELDRLREVKRGADAKFNSVAEQIAGAMAAWERQAQAELAPRKDGLATHVEFEPDLAGAADVQSHATAKGGNVVYETGLLGHAAQFDAMQHVEVPADLSFAADQSWSVGLWMKPTGSLNCVLAKIDPSGQRRGFEMIWQKGMLQINLVNRWVASAIEVGMKEPMSPRSDWHQVIVSYDGSRKAAGMKVFVDGKEAPLQIVRDSLEGSTDNTQPLRIGRRDNGLGYYGHLDELRIFQRTVGSEEAQSWYWSDRLRGILAVAAGKRNASQKDFLLDYYVERHTDAATRATHDAADAAKAAEANFRAELPKTLVMQEMAQPRMAHLLKRGQYDQPGAAVHAEVPASLSKFPTGAPRNRLGLAQWLVSPDHPLTARVAVNRLWQQCFGEGLVRTTNDFGLQGEAPTHRELLDWLALRFIQSGWDVKAMIKLMVSSAAWRQSSVASPELIARDPENRLLARGPRFRLSAETIRDQALAASGLLVERIGGPSVKPYQPAGLWEAVSYDGELTYDQSKGGDLWRRSLYTFWKRQSPPPSMLAFDGPTRETCTVRRPRTNTPLQALVLLNDATYIEAARALAALVLGKPGDDEARLKQVFVRVIARTPRADELDVLRRLLGQQRARFSRDEASAQQLLSTGASPVGDHFNKTELAAWTATAHALLNLDETLTRR